MGCGASSMFETAAGDGGLTPSSSNSSVDADTLHALAIGAPTDGALPDINANRVREVYNTLHCAGTTYMLRLPFESRLVHGGGTQASGVGGKCEMSTNTHHHLSAPSAILSIYDEKYDSLGEDVLRFYGDMSYMEAREVRRGDIVAVVKPDDAHKGRRTIYTAKGRTVGVVAGRASSSLRDTDKENLIAGVDLAQQCISLVSGMSSTQAPIEAHLETAHLGFSCSVRSAALPTEDGCCQVAPFLHLRDRRCPAGYAVMCKIDPATKYDSLGMACLPVLLYSLWQESLGRPKIISNINGRIRVKCDKTVQVY